MFHGKSRKSTNTLRKTAVSLSIIRIHRLQLPTVWGWWQLPNSKTIQYASCAYQTFIRVCEVENQNQQLVNRETNNQTTWCSKKDGYQFSFRFTIIHQSVWTTLHCHPFTNFISCNSMHLLFRDMAMTSYTIYIVLVYSMY